MINKIYLYIKRKVYFQLFYSIILLATFLSTSMISEYTAAAETNLNSTTSFDYTDLGYNLYGITLEDLYNTNINVSSNFMNAQISLPSSIDLSADNYFPAIGEQKANSCVAWSSTYYQFTYQVARLNNWDAKHDNSKVFSPKYIFNYTNGGDNDNGCYFADCYEF